VKRYLLIVHGGGPAVGAVEVPPCFKPTDALVRSAAEGNMQLVIVTEDELAPKGGLEGLFLAQGREILDAIRDFATDPEAAEKKYALPIDPTQN
jgi:hypothetical protein